MNAYRRFTDGSRLYQSNVTQPPTTALDQLLEELKQVTAPANNDSDDDDAAAESSPFHEAQLRDPPQIAWEPTVKFILSEGGDADGCKSLIERFVQELTLASERAYQYQRARYASVFERLDSEITKYTNWYATVCDLYSIDPKCGRLTLEKIKELRSHGVVDDFFWFRRRIKDLKQMNVAFDTWCRRLPVFGFNSGKYDLNLIRKYLLPILQQEQRSKRSSISIIKHCTTYKAIATDKLQFLDMTHYLAVGTSYAKWLVAMQIETKKFVWPHELFTSLEVGSTYVNFHLFLFFKFYLFFKHEILKFTNDAYDKLINLIVHTNFINNFNVRNKIICKINCAQ